MKRFLSIITLVTLGTVALAQTNDYTEDVASVDAIMAAIYDVISGDADTQRDWARFHYLFAKDAKLIPTGKSQDGSVNYRYWTPKEYQEMFTANRTAFFERELYRKTEAYGNIVHVFSTYETLTTPNGEVTNRGINSFQLLKGKDRYFIMNIFWSSENDGYPLPEKYLQDQ